MGQEDAMTTIVRIRRTLDVIRSLCDESHAIAVDRGWWDAERSDGELVALMHSELSEALEYLRHPLGFDAPSDHLPGVPGVTEEMADALIRIFDFCAVRNLDLGAALVAKMAFNKTRPRRHGGKRM
jgi:NTP pyrophosphatase (non-canonical NTP hydrolase)